MIKILEKAISFILSLFWVPGFIKPPNRTPVDFLTEYGYVHAGQYKNGLYHFYPAKYSFVYCWRYRGQVSLPKFSLRTTQAFNQTFLFSPASDHNWEWVDGLGNKHYVTYNTRKYLERNPMGSTVNDKEKRMKENSEKAIEQRHQQLKKIKGNSL